MALLNLWHSSCQADEGCLVFCSSHANLLLNTASCKLFRITTEAGLTHFVWREAPDDYELEFPVACRAFIENEKLMDDDIFAVKSSQQITPEQDIFCYAGYVYYLHKNNRGNLVIRRICAYSSQKIIEQIILDDFGAEVPQSIFLSNFFELKDNRRQYVMTCWGVVLADSYVYLPIFDEDRYHIYTRPVNAFIKEEIPPGGIFKAHEHYYQAALDEQGKLYLNHSSNVFLLNRQRQALKNEHQTIIIRMPGT